MVYEPNWYNLLRQYGISERQYKLLMTEQDGLCAICSMPFEEVKPGVDHNHETGEVRGLLCSNCNTGIGMFKDDPYILNEAANYLRKR